MNPARRREMVDREHPSLPIVGQCALLGVSRSSIYVGNHQIWDTSRAERSGAGWRSGGSNGTVLQTFEWVVVLQ